MMSQNVNVGDDMLIPDTTPEDADLETKSLPKYLENSVLRNRNFVARWSRANSLLSPSFNERMFQLDLFDQNALKSDWAISSDDLVNALLSVFEDQKPEVKRVLYQMLLAKILDSKKIEKETAS